MFPFYFSNFIQAKCKKEEKEYPPFKLIREEREYTRDFIISRDKHIAYFDADKLVEKLSLRKWQTGDTFIPFGMKGKSKRLPDRQKILRHPERTTMDSMLRGQNSLGNRRTDRQSFSNRRKHKKSNHPKD